MKENEIVEENTGKKTKQFIANFSEGISADSPHRWGHDGDGVLRRERPVLAVQTALLDQHQVRGVDDDRQHAGDVTEGVASEITSTWGVTFKFSLVLVGYKCVKIHVKHNPTNTGGSCMLWGS